MSDEKKFLQPVCSAGAQLAVVRVVAHHFRVRRIHLPALCRAGL